MHINKSKVVTGEELNMFGSFCLQRNKTCINLDIILRVDVVPEPMVLLLGALPEDRYNADLHWYTLRVLLMVPKKMITVHLRDVKPPPVGEWAQRLKHVCTMDTMDTNYGHFCKKMDFYFTISGCLMTRMMGWHVAGKRCVFELQIPPLCKNPT